jgi:class 3 adenylate cyclase
MKPMDIVREVRRYLEENGRASLRMLRRQYELDDDALDELIEELVDVQRVARREEKMLVWTAAQTPDTARTARPADRTVAHGAEARGAEARKVVTIVFADLIGSTSLHERLDAESVTRLMERYYRAMRGAVEAHGGTVVKLMGDGVMAAFGVPRVAEDDAVRAVRAGVAMQDTFRELARREFAAVGAIGLRVGINTGEVVVSPDNTDVVGDPVNVAARLQTEAHDGEVVIGESTRRLVAAHVTLAPLGSFALKGRTEAMKAYRVESLEHASDPTAAAFVGRDDELARMTAVYAAAVAAPAARLAVLLGSPGLGKSRLIAEFTRRVGDTASVITAQCDAEGGATFAPVAEALGEFLAQVDPEPADRSSAQGDALGSGLAPLSGLRAENSTESPQPQRGGQAIARGNAPGNAPGSGGIAHNLHSAIEAAIPTDDAERTRITAGISAMLAGSPASPEETFFVIRRFLAALARQRPIVLVIDDLHWAEPLLLDLVEHLVQWSGGVPLLVLVGARPELRDTRSSLATSGGLVTDVVTLSGLDAGAAMRLAANVVGAADLPASVAAKVLATSEGNPLFIGELVRMLVDGGALERQGERWIVGANLTSLEMPPTIHALLAARIERLRPEERTVLERAAVVGRHFSRSAVAALLGHSGSELDARLEMLRRTELIERDTGWFLGEPVLRFHHVLIRDAAYRRLLKGNRAELHEQLADWIETQVKDAPEHDETIGWHLEQSHQLRRELGPLDAKGKTLGERAAARLAAAGRRALARDDLPVTADLLGRAIDCLDRDDPARADLALDWCEALLAAGDVAAGARAIDELGRWIAADQPLAPSPTHLLSAGEASVRLSAWHTCFTGQLTVLTAPQALQATADAVASAAAELASLDDAAGEAKAHFVHALALARLGRVGGCEAALDHALAAARRADDRRRANTVLAIAPLAALWGPSAVTRASGRCLDVVRVLRITQGAPAVEAVALSCQAVLEALRGRTEAARRMLALSRKMVEDLGITHRLLEVDVFGGLIDLLEGDAVTAERTLRRAYDGLRDLGLGIDAARAAALLARALLVQKRGAEAEALSHESEALAGDDLKAAIAWRGVRAEALARRGEPTAAVDLANEAVAIAAATDALLDHADARLALAAALRAAGRGKDADAEERRAIDLWKAKGATLLVERMRRADAPVAATTAAPPPLAAPGPRRRIVSNRASEALVAFNAAMAAPDFAAFREQLSETYEEIDHPTGVSYGGDANVAALERLMRSRHASCQLEPLATLGDTLVLSRRRVHASATGGGRFDVGEYEQEAYTVAELDDRGRWCRHEVFAADHLGAAIARLYERHAEQLPEGPERERAAATTRSMAAQLGAPDDVEHAAGVIAPDFESVDHRPLSTWSMRGGSTYLDHLRALAAVASDIVIGVDDVLALAPDAVLVQRMHSGTERLGGGAYERPFLVLFATDVDGRLSRAEWFDAEREAEALARFEELNPSVSALGKRRIATHLPAPARRRVRANATTVTTARLDAAIAGRDDAPLADIFSQDMKVVDHPNGAEYGRDGSLDGFRRLLRAHEPRTRFEPLATIGASLGLFQRHISASGTGGVRFDVGAYERDEIVVIGTDAEGRHCAVDIFATDHLGDAIVRLYERYAELLPEGPERARAAATTRSVRVVVPGSFDLDGYTEAFRSDVAIVDHRVLGLGSSVGPQMLFRSMAAAQEVGDQLMSRPQDVLALTHDALLLQWLASGVGRESGGAFEWAFLRLFIFDPDGRVARYELFDADREGEALARFEQLVGGAVATPNEPFANSASRTDAELFRCFNGRDWEGVIACVAPVMVFDQRRRLVRSTCDRDVWLEQFRFLFDVPNSRFTTKLRATRGERLALVRVLFQGEVAGGGGPLAIDDHFALHEVDRAGRIIAIMLFDLEDEDAAHAELDARWEAGEGQTCERAWAVNQAFVRAVVRRDWDVIAALCAADFVEYDRRRLAVLGTTRGGDAWAQNFRALADLAPDSVYRTEHFRPAPRGFWTFGVWRGSREGGSYEIPLVVTIELDDAGRIVRADLCDEDAVDDAFARFAELAALPPTTPLILSSGPSSGPRIEGFANAATRAVDRGTAALAARDWKGFARLFAPSARHFDRTRTAQIESDIQEWLASFRQIVEMTTAPPVRTLLATRGERLALFRMLWQGARGDVGPSEIDWLLVVEVNEHGEHAAIVVYDPEDIDGAYAELDARWAAHGAAEHPRASEWLAGYLRAFAARDWAAMTALFTPDLVGQNHRLVSWGTRHGPEGVVSTLHAQVELAPDTRERVDHVRTSDRAVLFEYAWVGTREGGAFENVWLVLVELAPDGRACRADVWEPEQLDAARTRFAEISANPPAGPFDAFLKGHAAMTALDSWNAFDTAADPDWETLRASCAADMTFEDRQGFARLSGDREMMIASLRERVASGARAERRLLGTAGERIAVMRMLWTGGPADGRFEIEYLALCQVDAAGLVVAIILFGADDMRAAQREAWARWASIDPVAAPWVDLLTEITDAWNSHDRPRLRGRYSDDVVVEDHRHAGLGRIEGADAYLDSNVALWELAPDQRVDFGWSWPAVDRHGFVVTQRRVGTLADGGAFESEYVWLGLARGGRFTRLELFETEALDRALARLEELRPPSLLELRRTSPGPVLRSSAKEDPLRIPANAATRAYDRWYETVKAGNWDAVDALYGAAYVFDDRRPLFCETHAREGGAINTRFLFEGGWRPVRTLLATAGDRLALQRIVWTTSEAGAVSEIEVLELSELDGEGHFVRVVLFDPDDRAAASAELFERYVASGAGASHKAFELMRAWNTHDLARMRALLPEDFYLDDHRRTGVGRRDGADAYLASIAAMYQLSHDLRTETLYIVSVAAHGVVWVARWSGTNAEGGEFDAVYVCVGLQRDGRPAGLEIFELDDLKAALTRFEELRREAEMNCKSTVESRRPPRLRAAPSR